MSANEQAQDVAAYAARVRAQLADLPATEMDVLVEDLEQHLAEVAAEGEGSLEQRLGSAEQYARELRAAYTAGQPGIQEHRTNVALTLQEAAARLTSRPYASRWSDEGCTTAPFSA